MSDSPANLLRSLFVVQDLVAQNWIGQVVCERHPAPVIRLFHQLLGDKNTQLSSHPKDYNVVHIGFIDDDGTITPIAPLTIATGEAWAAAQESAS